MTQVQLPHPKQNARSTLEMFQYAALCVVAVVSATTFRRVLWTATQQADLFPEFQGIVLFLADCALLALIVVTALRLIVEVDFRRSFLDCVFLILRRHGGVWWLVLVIWMGLSALWAEQPILAVYDALSVFGNLVFAVALAHFVLRGAGQGILLALVVSAAVQSVIGIAQLVNGGPLGLTLFGEIRWIPPAGVFLGYLSPDLYRANGLTVNPNNLAGYLMIGLFAVVALKTLTNPPQKAHLPLAFVAFLIVVGLVATLSRTVILVIIVAFAVFAFRQLAFRIHLPRKTVLLLILGIVVILAILLVGSMIFLSNIQDRLLHVRDDIEARVVLIAQTITVIQQHPVFGTGADNLMLEIERNRLQVDPYAVLVAAVPAHNVYLIILAELGPIGLILFAFGCLSIVVGLRRRENPGVALWASCFLAIGMAMLLDFYFWRDTRSRTLIFYVLGMGWAAFLQYSSRVDVIQNGP